jgi:AraC-like DNA-binding protein
MKMEYTEQTLIAITILLVVAILLISVVFTAMYVYLYRKNKELQAMIEGFPKGVEEAVSKKEKADSTKEYEQLLKVIYEEHLYADQNMNRDIFAARMNLSRHALNKILASNTDGMSFPQWINNIRIELASKILTNEPDKAVVDIAQEVGLTQNNFHRLFRLRYGMTPNEYRQFKK